jgi:hypothetical protein
MQERESTRLAPRLVLRTTRDSAGLDPCLPADAAIRRSAQSGRLTGEFWPKFAALQDGADPRFSVFAGTFLMELAGLEPATSWVRSKAPRA